MTEKELKKHPLGLEPEYIWKRESILRRIDDINAATKRYEDANVSVPKEWGEELSLREYQLRWE